MRYCSIFAIFVAASVVGAMPLYAKEPKESATTRDGSTKERAIIVTESEATYVHWEHQYLRKHFPGFTYLTHATIPDHKDDNRGYDLHEIIWHGRKKEVWFDISKPFQEFGRKHGYK